MSYFLNLKNGEVDIQTYRLPEAAVTSIEDLKDAYENKRNEILSASLDEFNEEEARKIMDSFEKGKYE